MNRPPQKADSWWLEHIKTCGGTFTKVSEPPKASKQKPKKANQQKIDQYVQKATAVEYVDLTDSP
jgi:hypothetical protein